MSSSTDFDKTIQTRPTPSPLDIDELLEAYRTATRALLIFDYDGTLTPIVQDPAAATPAILTLRDIRVLATENGNELWIVSGRDQKFLDQHFGWCENIGLSAKHGCFTSPRMSRVWHAAAEDLDMGWREEVLSIFRRYEEQTPGSVLEEKKVAITWHYRRAGAITGFVQAGKCSEELKAKVASKFDLEVMAGKMNLEVRPRSLNKGEIVRRLLEEDSSSITNVKSCHEQIRRKTDPVDFVMCVGDDLTDEDMFRTLNEQRCVPQHRVFSIVVDDTHRPTLAHWQVADPKEVLSLLTTMAGTADWPTYHRLSKRDKELYPTAPYDET